jgi:Fe-S cluster biogenesis protein NfuA
VLGYFTLMGAPRDQILEVVRDIVCPLIRADGGQIYLVSVADRALALHLTGRFSGCPGNTLAKRRVLEPLLAARFPDLKLEITSGPLIPKGAEELV